MTRTAAAMTLMLAVLPLTGCGTVANLAGEEPWLMGPATTT
jgi:hypothetical protein